MREEAEGLETPWRHRDGRGDSRDRTETRAPQRQPALSCTPEPGQRGKAGVLGGVKFPPRSLLGVQGPGRASSPGQDPFSLPPRSRSLAPHPAPPTLWLWTWETLLVLDAQDCGCQASSSEEISLCFTAGKPRLVLAQMKLGSPPSAAAQSSGTAWSPLMPKSWLGFGFLIILGGRGTYPGPLFTPNSTQVTFCGE